MKDINLMSDDEVNKEVVRLRLLKDETVSKLRTFILESEVRLEMKNIKEESAAKKEARARTQVVRIQNIPTAEDVKSIIRG